VSATGRGAIRKANDNYATPGWCVDRLLERVALPGGHWLEPCAGYGAIINRIEAVRKDVSWSAVEIRPDHERRLREYECRALHIGDFLTLSKGGHWSLCPPFDVVITNPPYFFARQFVQACRPIAKIVVMLLRLNVLGGDKRQPWLAQDMPDVYVLPNRPSFRAGGPLKTDATEYAWFVWEPARRTHGRVQVLELTPLAERRKR
jgi:hypothetical protein